MQIPDEILKKLEKGIMIFTQIRKLLDSDKPPRNEYNLELIDNYLLDKDPQELSKNAAGYDGSRTYRQLLDKRFMRELEDEEYDAVITVNIDVFFQIRLVVPYILFCSLNSFYYLSLWFTWSFINASVWNIIAGDGLDTSSNGSNTLFCFLINRVNFSIKCRQKKRASSTWFKFSEQSEKKIVIVEYLLH